MLPSSLYPQTYWVQPGRLLAGPCPGSDEHLAALAAAGVTCILNLQFPEEVNHAGEPFRDYTVPYRALLDGRQPRFLRFPVPDFSIPTRAGMVAILDALDAALADGHTIYLHCWGGKGRTGTVVGCWLARHGHAQGQAAVEKVWKLREGLKGDSPENETQRAFVRGWQVGE
jgi:protein-tyrosine phosphatase